MNIFYLDPDPKICARYHNDKHVVKMIVETAQLLCSAHWASGSEAPYKSMNPNHPCGIWTRANIGNYNWLCKLGKNLISEYSYRYNETGEKKHKTQEVIEWCTKNKPKIPKGEFYEPPLAMPDECKINNDAILSYRNYYIQQKRAFCTWKNREIPSWFH